MWLIKQSAGFVSPCGCRKCHSLQPDNEELLETFTEVENTEDYCEDDNSLDSDMVNEKILQVLEDPMLFWDDVFSIEPMVSDS